MDLVRNLTGLIQAACWLRTTRKIDHVGFPSLYVRTDPYGPYGTRRIHLRVLSSMWPKYTRTPIHLTTLITSPIGFSLYFQNCSRYWYAIFRKARTIYTSGYSKQIMKIDRCVFALHVFRHNNPHFQKWQIYMGHLRQHYISDKFIFYCNKTTSIPFSCIKIRILNLIIKITAKIPLRLVVYWSIPIMTAIGSNDGLPMTAHGSHVPQLTSFSCLSYLCFF